MTAGNFNKNCRGGQLFTDAIVILGIKFNLIKLYF